MAAEQDQAKAMRRAALDLLARREQSAPELVRKLVRRFGDEARASAESLVAELAAAGLQCDRRFADNYVRSRISRGQGPLKVIAELQQRYGLSQSQAQQAVHQGDHNWTDVATGLLCKEQLHGQNRQRALRLLWRRGFTAEQAADAWSRHLHGGTGK